MTHIRIRHMNHRHDVIKQSVFKDWDLTNTVMCYVWNLTTKLCWTASCDENSDAANWTEALRKLTAKLGVLLANVNITLAVSGTDSEHNPTFHVTSESRDTAVIYLMSPRHHQNCVHSHVECADRSPGPGSVLQTMQLVRDPVLMTPKKRSCVKNIDIADKYFYHTDVNKTNQGMRARHDDWIISYN